MIETNKREIFARIGEKQSIFFGDVMRRGQLKYVVTAEKLEGKVDSGRAREGGAEYLSIVT